MGVDLTLLPVDHLTGGLGFSHSMLKLARWRDDWGRVAKVEQHHGCPMPRPFSAFVARRDDGEPGYGDLESTPYGDPYVMVPAGPLAKAIRCEAPMSRAARAYLETLPEDHWIVLHWH